MALYRVAPKELTKKRESIKLLSQGGYSGQNCHLDKIPTGSNIEN